MYCDRNADGVPEEWEEHMRNARDMTLNQFSATRMLRSYIEMMYS
jgi:glucan phosphorylase